MMLAVESLAKEVRMKKACEVLGIPRASYYYYRKNIHRKRVPVKPPLALSSPEEQGVLDTLHSERFCDKSPREVYATLLDEGIYLCSIRTMYRILEKHHEVRERRNQLRHPSYQKPELLATAPNQVWSWDITKLKGPTKWSYFYLYVILDIFSRYVVGWMVAHREQAALAERLISETAQKQGIQPGQLIIHADRGSSMTSKPVAFLLSDLGITKSHSRPYVNNDNPYSESQFKTLKYHPDFPGYFVSIESSRVFCKDFFTWYNTEHYHSGIGLLTPETVHYGRTDHIVKERSRVLKIAFENHPERFKGKIPEPPQMPLAAWINQPIQENTL
ncbi:MAG: IS3 family transposase [wastewater metagenome]|nr:IS3 family transposase [Candidatus Loosdrechtia aerotolerans]